MRLSIDQRSRIVAIYFEHRLHFMKKKYEKLSKIAAEIGSEKICGEIFNNW